MKGRRTMFKNLMAVILIGGILMGCAICLAAEPSPKADQKAAPAPSSAGKSEAKLVPAKKAEVPADPTVVVPVTHSHGVGGCDGMLTINRQGINFVGKSLSYSCKYEDIKECKFTDNTDYHSSKLSNYPWLELLVAVNGGKDEQRQSFVFLGPNSDRPDKAAGLTDFKAAQNAYRFFCKK
jgi:hypothetical protein